MIYAAIENEQNTHTHKQITYIHTINQDNEIGKRKKEKQKGHHQQQKQQKKKVDHFFHSFFIVENDDEMNETHTHTNMQFDMTNKTQNNGPLLHTDIKHYFFFSLNSSFNKREKYT